MYRLFSTNNNKKERFQNPRSNANVFEILTFSWMLNLFKIGQKRDITENDLYANLNDHKSSTLGIALEKRWKMELEDAKKESRGPSLFRVLFHMYRTRLFLFGLSQALIEIVIKLCQPLLMGELLAFFNSRDSKNTTPVQAYIYATCLILSMLIYMVLYQWIQSEMIHLGMKIRIACSSIIFKKALRLNKLALGETTVGQIVNILSNDVFRFDTALLSPHYLWISPLQTVVVTYFIWQKIGVSSLIGLAACFSFIPLQAWLGKKTSEFRLKTAVRTDERVRLMNEIISGIQMIKMYTWEKLFSDLIQRARKKEIQVIKGSSYIKATLASFVVFHTKMSLFFCILSYILLGNYISTQKVFVIVMYYHILQSTLATRFTHSVGQIGEVLVSIKRIQKFLLCGEKHDHVGNLLKTDKLDTGNGIKNGNSLSNYSSSRDNVSQLRNYGINVSNVTAKWTETQTENSLQSINLTLRPNQLTAIVGPIGAGKSSLIQAILRELPLSDGRISMRGVISYASQEPWLFSGSVKQNILFDSLLDDERYKQVVEVCALEIDFQQLPYGDRSLVGERGVSLSGGQKARISLARAIYKQADIYLLDDPLSAVDTKVGKKIFKSCIKSYLQDKTCILVTHQLQYLSHVDYIVLINNANILMEGTYEDFKKTNLDITKFLQSSVENKDFAKEKSISCQKPLINKENKNFVFDQQISNQNVETFVGENRIGKFEENPVEILETRSTGNVSLSVYMSYIFAGGTWNKLLFFIFICIINQILASSGDLWLTYWVNIEEHVFHSEETMFMHNGTLTTNGNSTTRLLWWSISRQTCILGFAFFTFMMIMSTAIRSATFVSLCTRASTNLHQIMFDAIIKANMSFFNTNSSGSILNRFSKDMGIIDEKILVLFMDFLHYGSTLMGIVVVAGIINLYLLIPTFILGYMFYKVTVFYLSTSRSIKRLEGITRSPLIAHMNASLQGLTTIRAFNAEYILCQEFDNHQDFHSSAWYISVISSRAFSLWLDIVCLTYIGLITFSFIVFDYEKLGAHVGLAITQAYALAGMLQLGVRQLAELENLMTSVERILEFSKVQQEDIFSSTVKELPTSWPSNGQIIFKNYNLRYSLETPFVLKNINIRIESKQKVGIVGRTGAGKSSLIGALFRLAINDGSIFINDVEIHDLGLHDLRSKMSIIPQEPVLFLGTIRTNLDPFNEYDDSILWNALDDVRLKHIVKDLKDGLDSKLTEGGSNFSVGQRQLLCLARAIIRGNRILILDEATANVDQQTDALIQNTIRNKFQSCTVLTIAHRLNTIVDSDKILVLDAGAVVEFDNPHDLLSNKNGYFYKMIEQTGRTSADSIHSKIKQRHETKILHLHHN